MSDTLVFVPSRFKKRTLGGQLMKCCVTHNVRWWCDGYYGDCGVASAFCSALVITEYVNIYTYMHAYMQSLILQTRAPLLNIKKVFVFFLSF